MACAAVTAVNAGLHANGGDSRHGIHNVARSNSLVFIALCDSDIARMRPSR